MAKHPKNSDSVRRGSEESAPATDAVRTKREAEAQMSEQTADTVAAESSNPQQRKTNQK